MTISRSRLFAPEIIDNAAADELFTVPSTPATLLLINGRLRFINYSAAAVTIKAWAVPSGGSEGDDNIMLDTTSIAAHGFLDVDIPQLAAGGKVSAQAGAATSITAQPLDGAYYSV